MLPYQIYSRAKSGCPESVDHTQNTKRPCLPVPSQGKHCPMLAQGGFRNLTTDVGYRWVSSIADLLYHDRYAGLYRLTANYEKCTTRGSSYCGEPRSSPEYTKQDSTLNPNSTAVRYGGPGLVLFLCAGPAVHCARPQPSKVHNIP